jgi:hypothetical protein
VSAIAAIIGRKINECQQEVLSRHGGAGPGKEGEIREQAARDVCSEGFSRSRDEYHESASARFEGQVPRTRDEMQRKEDLQKEIVREALPVLFGPLVLFFRK